MRPGAKAVIDRARLVTSALVAPGPCCARTRAIGTAAATRTDAAANVTSTTARVDCAAVRRDASSSRAAAGTDNRGNALVAVGTAGTGPGPGKTRHPRVESVSAPRGPAAVA